MLGELTIVVFLFLISVPPLLVQKFSADKRLSRPFWQFGDYNPLVISILVLFASVYIVNFINPYPNLSSPDEEIEFGKRRGLIEHVQAGYEDKMLAEPANLLWHFKALEARYDYSAPRRSADVITFFDHRVSDPRSYYDRLAESRDINIKDAGNFGIAALYVLRNTSLEFGKDYLRNISDQNKPAVAYLKAIIAEKERSDSAIYFFKQEIANKGNIEESVEKLANHFYWRADMKALAELNDDVRTSGYVPVFYKQTLAFDEYRFLDFLILEFSFLFSKWNMAGILAALFIFLIWLYYIHKIDLYEPERWKHVLFTILFSCALTILISYYYHFEHHYLDIRKTNELWDNLFYYLVGVAVPEEICKLIPVLVMLRFTKAINEPMDYIIFGSLSALSFAFVENTLYFDEDSIFNIHGRALWTSMGHAADTCIITYCMMIPKWHPRARGLMKNQAVMFLFGFTLAVFSHGFYDFFLLPQFRELWIVPFFILLTSIVVFTSMVNNCLNNSPFYYKSRSLNTERLGALLAAGLLAVIVFEYCCMSFIYGAETGNVALVYALLHSWYLLVFLATRLTGLDIFPRRWEKLKFFASINPVAMILRKKINYSNYIGKEILINGGRRNAPIVKLLPIKGRISRREAVDDNTGWLVVDIDKAILIGGRRYTQLWMHAMDENIPVINNPNAEVKIWVTREGAEDKENKTEMDFIFIDRVLVN